MVMSEPAIRRRPGPAALALVDRPGLLVVVGRTALALAFSLVAAGCGSSTSFGDMFAFGDSEDEPFLAAGEELIEGDLAARIGLGPLEATCFGEDLEAGDSFECSAVGGSLPPILFTATIDEDEDEVFLTTLNLLLAEQINEVEAVATQLLETQTGQTIGVDNFDCGDSTVVIAVGEQLDCRVTVPPDSTVYEAPVTVDDLNDLSITVNVGSPVG